MAALEVRVGGAKLPGGITEIKRSDELLWSEGTGRSATTGAMTGSVVAGKQTWSLKWGPVTASDYAAIRSAIGGGFKALSVKMYGSEVAGITVYRGTVSAEGMGMLGGDTWYRNVSVDLVEK